MALQNKSENEIRAWVKDFHDSTDSLNTDTLHNFFTPTATLRFANNEEVVGIDGVRSFFGATSHLLSKMTHKLVSLDKINNKLYLDCFISYVLAQDPESKEITIPALATVYLLPEEEARGKGSAVLERMNVFLDLSPVLARAGELEHSSGKNGE